MKIFAAITSILMLLALAGCDTVIQSEIGLNTDAHIQVYFTEPIFQTTDNDLAKGLLEFLDRAQTSLDIAIHSISDERILDMLNLACLRNVQVRMVVEANAFHFDALQPLTNRCVQLKARNEEDRGTMHHKFAVADGQRVWTGSANWTTSGLRSNANDAVRIDNPELASRYTEAFERLFIEEKFGESTLGISAQPVMIDESNVRVYFAPHPQLEDEIVRYIQEAEQSIRIAMFAYTNDKIHKALLDAMTRGVNIQALWGNRTRRDCDVSEIDEMLQLSTGYIVPIAGAMHHKFALIDDRRLITGSANWSANGMNHNDENILVIEHPALIRAYNNHFNQLTREALRYDRDFSPPKYIERHFNTLPGTARIEWHATPFLSYDVCRVEAIGGDCSLVASNLSQGTSFWVDEAVEPGETYFYRVRAISDEEHTDFSQHIPITVSDEALTIWTSAQVEEALSELQGRQVHVEFEVKEVFVSAAGNVFLNAGEDHQTDFTAFIPACAVENFSDLNISLDDLEGQHIRVSGELISYQGPEIKLYDSGQIKLPQP